MVSFHHPFYMLRSEIFEHLLRISSTHESRTSKFFYLLRTSLYFTPTYIHVHEWNLNLINASKNVSLLLYNTNTYLPDAFKYPCSIEWPAISKYPLNFWISFVNIEKYLTQHLQLIKFQIKPQQTWIQSKFPTNSVQSPRLTWYAFWQARKNSMSNKSISRFYLFTYSPLLFH